MKAHEAFHAITQEEPSADFLSATADGLAACEMAELVTLLRKTAFIPKQLADVCAGVNGAVIDVCGTGGSKGSRLNTSTLAALFLPDFGACVVKHGGRSASGKKGSLDLLESLGLEPQKAFESAAEHLRTEGLCYLGAGYTYAAFARYAPLRKAAGRPTLFNLLGPLLNPMPLTTRLLGCYDMRTQELLAEVVCILEEQTLLVCSHDDEGFLDEGAPWSDTHLVHVKQGAATRIEMPARMRRPGPRDALFSDGVQAAHGFLGLEKGAHNTSSAAAVLVGFNVALAVFATRLAEGACASQAQECVTSALATFQHGLETRVSLAQTRMERMRDLQPTHVNSPVVHAAELHPRKASRSTANQNHAPARPFPWHADDCYLIAEIKRGTPTRAFADTLTLEQRIASYERAGAISVVTHPSFGGDLELLAQVRAASDKPILAKDFVRTEQEIDALIGAGADGVLVLIDMLGETRAGELAAYIEAQGRAAFVESSFSVPTFGVPMLNSRNLFSLCEARAFRDGLAARLPARSAFVVASSVNDPIEARLLAARGGAIVVGGALMAQPSETAVRAWIASAYPGGVLKACGARDADDALVAIKSGADWVGVNLIPHSKRLVSANGLETILSASHNDSKLFSRLVFLTDAASDASVLARIDAILQALPFEGRALEQCYAAPRLALARGHISPMVETSYSHNENFSKKSVHPQRLARLMAVLLDGSRPGSGTCEPYPDATPGSARFPTLCAGGVTPGNALARLGEARERGHAAAGLDAASGVEERGASGKRLGFSAEKIASLARILKGMNR